MPPRKTAVKDSKKLPDLKWIERMEYWLFESLLAQDRLGKRADQGFKSEAWLPVIETVQEAYNLSGHSPVREITKTQCQGKEAAFKTLYKEHCWLLDQSGFGLDPVTGLIEASDEAWAEVIKVRLYT
jgi:hypothetical protein